MLALRTFARRAAAPAFAAAATFGAACADHTPTAPAAPLAAAAPSAALAAAVTPSGVYGVVRIIDRETGDPRPGGDTLRVVPFQGTPFSVVDNGPADLDARASRMRFAIPAPLAMSYTACIVPGSPAWTSTPEDSCKTSTPSYGEVLFGIVGLHRKAVLHISMRTSTGYFTPGATLQLTGPDGFSRTITDGAAADENGSYDGIVSLRLPKPGTYSWCETQAPPGYALGPLAWRCGSKQTDWGGIYSASITQTKVVAVPSIPGL